MLTEILFFIIIIGLISFLIYREKQFERTIKLILAAKLSENAAEFKEAVDAKKATEPVIPEPEGIPLEEVDPRDLLKAMGQKEEQ